jgi:hypothetical protein
MLCDETCSQAPQTDQLFRQRLDEQIKMSHPLVRLSKLLNWEEIERSFSAHFSSARGRHALPPRLVAGLLYLQHANDASDEAVVTTWLENPYWQYFTGEDCLQTELSIDPSSLTRWRKRIGEEGVEVLLSVTIDAAKAAGLIKQNKRQEQTVCAARARSRMHLERQGSNALRVWREGHDRNHLKRRLGGGHAQHARQPLGRPHTGRDH